jgi:glucose-1-phosphate cytidylyltransferase
MKCLIFCGGFGTRMNNGLPGMLKPLTILSGKEILRHIIGIYEHYGVREFVLLGGYRIKDLCDFADAINGLSITVLDTGEATPTGGRLLQAEKLINKNEDFLLTYGDSLTNFNLHDALVAKNKLSSDMLISVYSKKLEYGILDLDKNSLLEKIYEKTYTVKINAGFYVLNSNIFKYINSLEESFELDVLPRLLNNKTHKMATYEVSFWHPMDTPNDRESLENILLQNPKILLGIKNI